MKLTWTSNRPDQLKIEGEGTQVKLTGNHALVKCATTVWLKVASENGIYNECQVTVYPVLKDAPQFIKQPCISESTEGKLTLEYILNKVEDMGEEISRITWYRCKNQERREAVLVKMPHDKNILRSYPLTCGDVGFYVMAIIEPGYEHSQLGDAVCVMTKQKIDLEDLSGVGLEKYHYETDFSDFSTKVQNQLISGTWTVDSYRPLDQKQAWERERNEAWSYEQGIDGAFHSKGLLTTGRGARLLWTQEKVFKNMRTDLKLNIEKIAGQGFGSATEQYLEIYIKYDTRNLSGYGLRIQRTTKYGCATDFTLYEYENGEGRAISESVSTAAFCSLCHISLWTKSNQLYMKVSSTSKLSLEQREAGLEKRLKLSAGIKQNTWGGMGIQHTGTVSLGNRIQLKELKINYSD